MKLTLLPIFLLSSMSAFANCEKSTDVAGCFEKQSFAQVSKYYDALLKATKPQVSYNKTAISELTQSQKSWLKYRDDYCYTYSNYHSEKNNHSNCIVELNQQRVEQLKQDLESAD